MYDKGKEECRPEMYVARGDSYLGWMDGNGNGNGNGGGDHCLKKKRGGGGGRVII